MFSKWCWLPPPFSEIKPFFVKQLDLRSRWINWVTCQNILVSIFQCINMLQFSYNYLKPHWVLWWIHISIACVQYLHVKTHNKDSFLFGPVASLTPIFDMLQIYGCIKWNPRCGETCAHSRGFAKKCFCDYIKTYVWVNIEKKGTVHR